jgi:hypothetical protein
MLDFDSLVLGPVYETFGKPSVLTIGPSTYDLAVVDLTKGITVENDGGVGIQTVRTAADVRRNTLAALGISLDNLPGSALALTGTDWTIKTFIEGEAEVRLILMHS